MLERVECVNSIIAIKASGACQLTACAAKGERCSRGRSTALTGEGLPWPRTRPATPGRAQRAAIFAVRKQYTRKLQ